MDSGAVETRKLDSFGREARGVKREPHGSHPCLGYTRLMATTSNIIRDPEILHGTPVFRGTRVPVRALFDALEAGETIEEFLEGFPAVAREMAVAVLEQARELLASKS